MCINTVYNYYKIGVKVDKLQSKKISMAAIVTHIHLHINWSNFKPEFSGKPEEDAEAHLLCSNDWMHVHHFNDDVKVQRFVLHC